MGYCDIYHEDVVDDSFDEEKVEPVLVERIETGLTYVPFFIVKDTYSGFVEIPLRFIADKNRIYYQKQSYHQRKIALCCNPVPVIKDASRDVEDPLTIGPDNYVNISDPNGSFTWQEPLALSLKESRDDLADLRNSLNSDIAQFLLNPASRQSATATEVMIQPVEASLTSFLIVFLDGVNNLVNNYNFYCGSSSSNYVIVSPDIYDTKEIDAQFLFGVNSLVESEIYTREGARAIIQEKYPFFGDGK